MAARSRGASTRLRRQRPFAHQCVARIGAVELAAATAAAAPDRPRARTAPQVEILPDRPRLAPRRTRGGATATGRCGLRRAPRPGRRVEHRGRRARSCDVARRPAALHEHRIAGRQQQRRHDEEAGARRASAGCRGTRCARASQRPLQRDPPMQLRLHRRGLARQLGRAPAAASARARSSALLQDASSAPRGRVARRPGGRWPPRRTSDAQPQPALGGSPRSPRGTRPRRRDKLAA